MLYLTRNIFTHMFWTPLCTLQDEEKFTKMTFKKEMDL